MVIFVFTNKLINPNDIMLLDEWCYAKQLILVLNIAGDAKYFNGYYFLQSLKNKDAYFLYLSDLDVKEYTLTQYFYALRGCNNKFISPINISYTETSEYNNNSSYEEDDTLFLSVLGEVVEEGVSQYDANITITLNTMYNSTIEEEISYEHAYSDLVEAVMESNPFMFDYDFQVIAGSVLGLDVPESFKTREGLNYVTGFSKDKKRKLNRFKNGIITKAEYDTGMNAVFITYTFADDTDVQFFHMSEYKWYIVYLLKQGGLSSDVDEVLQDAIYNYTIKEIAGLIKYNSPTQVIETKWGIIAVSDANISKEVMHCSGANIRYNKETLQLDPHPRMYSDTSYRNSLCDILHTKPLAFHSVVESEDSLEINIVCSSYINGANGAYAVVPLLLCGNIDSTCCGVLKFKCRGNDLNVYISYNVLQHIKTDLNLLNMYDSFIGDLGVKNKRNISNNLTSNPRKRTLPHFN